MATVGSLIVRLGLNSQGFNKGLDKSFRRLQRFGSSVRNVGAGLTAGLTLPILGAAAAVVKASSDMESGFAGVQNELFFYDNTRMLFGDAKESIGGLVSELKE